MEEFLRLHWPYVSFYGITFFWLLEFVLFPSKHEGKDFQEKKSFYFILITILSNLFLTILFTWFSLFQFPEELAFPIRVFGLAVYLTGLVLRYLSTYTLGKYFSRDVNVEKDQELISHGPYKKLRHPLYLGLMLLTLGIPLFFYNVLALTFAIFSMGRTLNQRMEIEEKEMEKAMGERYKEWKKYRYRFIPYIY